jgi:uncharacterized protein YaaQ
MKMIMAIIPRDEAESVLQALVAANHTATYMETRGGMLRQAQMSLFIAVQDEDLETVTGIIGAACCSEVVVEAAEERAFSGPMPTRPTLGGAVIFIWDVERSQAR